MTETGKEILVKSLKRAAYFAACVFVFFLLWTVAEARIKNEYVFPTVGDTLKEVGKLFTEEKFLKSYLASFLRTIRVFFISFSFALFFAVIAYLYPVFSKILAPIVGILRALPTLAVLLIILLLTTPYDAPVVVGFMALFPMLYTGFSSSLLSVDEKLVDMCKVYKVPLKKRIFKMYIPNALPYILRESSAGLSFGIKLIVSAEIMASTYISLGSLMKDAASVYYLLARSRLFALTLVVIATGLLLECIGLFFARMAERRVK